MATIAACLGAKTQQSIKRNKSLVHPSPAHSRERLSSSVDRYGADPRDPPTREALARNEGRSLEGVSREDVARDAEAIEQLMEIVLQKEKDETEKIKKKKVDPNSLSLSQ